MLSSTFVFINIHYFPQLQQCCYTWLLLKNDALTPVVQSKIKIYWTLLSNSIGGFVVHSLSASSQQLASFWLAKKLLKIQFWVQSHIIQKIKKKNGVRCCVCTTNQPWPPKLLCLIQCSTYQKRKTKHRHFKSSMLDSIPPTSLYIYGKERCPKLSLHDKHQTKSLQWWLQCSTHKIEEIMQCIFLWWYLFWHSLIIFDSFTTRTFFNYFIPSQHQYSSILFFHNTNIVNLIPSHSQFDFFTTLLLHLAPAKKWSINSCCSKQNKNLLNSSISQTASLALLYTLSLQARNSLLHFDLLNDCSILGTIPHYTKNKKERCSMLCLHEKPTMTTKTHAWFNALHTKRENQKHRHITLHLW